MSACIDKRKDVAKLVPQVVAGFVFLEAAESGEKKKRPTIELSERFVEFVDLVPYVDTKL